MLSWLFLKRTNKQGWFRHLVTIFSVSLAVTVLLACLTIAQGLQKGLSRQDLNFGLNNQSNAFSKQEFLNQGKKDITLFYKNQIDITKKQSINVLHLSKLSKKSPNWPGLKDYPKKDEVLVSSSLNELLKQKPELKELFEGRKIKEINTYALNATPTEFFAVDQITSEKLKTSTFFELSDKKVSKVKNDIKKIKKTKKIIISSMMTLGGLGICFPLFILIISGTRIGILQREERYSALSLLGTSKKQINRIVLAETLVSTFIGILVGYIINLTLTIDFLSKNRFAMFQQFYSQDLYLSLVKTLAIFVAIILVVILVNFLAIRKAKTSPLGTIKKQKMPKKPKIWRIIPALIVIGFFTFIELKGGHKYWKELMANNRENLYMFGIMICFVLSMIGLLLIGAYLTYLVSLLLNKMSKKSSGIMASKRLKIFAKPLTHSANGVVLALFVGSFFVTSLVMMEKTINKVFETEINFNSSSEVFMTDKTVKTNMNTTYSEKNLGLLTEEQKAKQREKQEQKIAKDFEKFVMQNSKLSSKISLVTYGKNYYDEEKHVSYDYVTCNELKQTTQLKCPKNIYNNQLLRIYNKYDEKGNLKPKVEITDKIPEGAKANYSSADIIFKNRKDVEEGRKKIVILGYKYSLTRPVKFYNTKTLDIQKGFDFVKDSFGNFVNLIYIGTIATVLIGGFSLAIATIGGFFERKKSFSNLRLMGIDIKTLNKTVLIESFVPMILPSIIATISGISFANVALGNMEKKIVHSLPESTYFVIVIASFIMALGIIYVILPILKRITELDKNRTE